MTMITWLVGVCAVPGARVAEAAEATGVLVSGTVVRSTDHAPLRDVAVRLTSREGTTNANTNADGFFSVVLTTAQHTIECTVSLEGYQADTGSGAVGLFVQNDKADAGEIRLEPTIVLHKPTFSGSTIEMLVEKMPGTPVLTLNHYVVEGTIGTDESCASSGVLAEFHINGTVIGGFARVDVKGSTAPRAARVSWNWDHCAGGSYTIRIEGAPSDVDKEGEQTLMIVLPPSFHRQTPGQSDRPGDAFMIRPASDEHFGDALRVRLTTVGGTEFEAPVLNTRTRAVVSK